MCCDRDNKKTKTKKKHFFRQCSQFNIWIFKKILSQKSRNKIFLKNQEMKNRRKKKKVVPLLRKFVPLPAEEGYFPLVPNKKTFRNKNTEKQYYFVDFRLKTPRSPNQRNRISRRYTANTKDAHTKYDSILRVLKKAVALI